MDDFNPYEDLTNLHNEELPVRWWWLVAGLAGFLIWGMIIWTFVAAMHGAFE